MTASTGTRALNAAYAQPAVGVASVTRSDSVNLTRAPTRALWVGAAGDVSLVFLDGTTDTISGVQAGTLLPFQVLRVNDTGTTVANASLKAIY